MKTCATCGIEKEDFPKCKSKPDGLQPHCRECYNAKMAEYMTKRYHKRRNEFIVKRGSKCEQCGSVEKLEIDHTDPATKSFDLGKALSGWSEKRIQEELDKCQVLCKDCHLSKSVSERAVGHGGGLSGKRNCRCILCKEQKNIYQKNYIERHPKRYCECGTEIDRRGRTKRCRSCNCKNK